MKFSWYWAQIVYQKLPIHWNRTHITKIYICAIILNDFLLLGIVFAVAQEATLESSREQIYTKFYTNRYFYSSILFCT